MTEPIHEFCTTCGHIERVLHRSYIDRTEWRCVGCGRWVDAEYEDGDYEDLSTAPNP